MRILKNKVNTPPESQDPYHRAYAEWSGRIGQARVQLNNWRLAFIISIALVVLMLIAIISVLSLKKTYVYVAEVKPAEQVVNLTPLTRSYTATEAQEEAFVGQFLNNIMTLPLDPVVARINWLNAYGMVSGQANLQLTAYANSINPFQGIGTVTKSVTISDFHPVSNQSYQFTFTQTVYDGQGQVSSTTLYSGIFTVVQGPMPTTPSDLLFNPLGLKIVYFSFSNKD